MKIIAESAFNHNGSLDDLMKLALASKRSGADYFTVQVMDPNAFCVADYSKTAIYQENSFSQEEWNEVFDYCNEIEIDLIPCVLDENSFDWCYEYGYRFLKLHATDITNVPLLKKIKDKQDCRLILETQCSTFQDIAFGLKIIGPYVEVLFQGYSNYPTEIEDLRLNAIDAYRRDFPDYQYGLADHSPTVMEIPLVALGKGYSYLEKHITLTRNNRNFDWQVSLYPEEFSNMVQTISLYSRSLGPKVKHPVKNEIAYRNTIFKKVIPGRDQLKRSDSGADYIQHLFESYSRDDVGIALIARLKSERLKRKVLKPFMENSIIEDLLFRMRSCEQISDVKLATSDLSEDNELVICCGADHSFRGHAISVLDRMLSYAMETKVGGVFRVTGDNPLTDIVLIDKMVELFKSDDELDYVRVNNIPFGVSAELFSTKFLWKMYCNMENPLDSEYLSWFVLNDPSAKKGCINFIPNDNRFSLINLSVDFQEDYDRVMRLVEPFHARDLKEINLKHILQRADYKDIIDENKNIKLPQEKSILLREYLQLINNLPYKVKIDLHEEDVLNW